jgi:hypothetical protein
MSFRLPFTIHGVPKRSMHIPNPSAQNAGALWYRHSPAASIARVGRKITDAIRGGRLG